MRKYAALAMLGATMLCLTAAVQATQGIQLHIEYDGRDTSAPNTVGMTLSNTTDHEIFVYGYNSALVKPDGRTTGNWFTVTDAFGNKVGYKGRYVVSGAPGPEQFLRIGAGSRFSASVDLGSEYSLPPSGAISVSTAVATYDRIPEILKTGESDHIPHVLVESNVASFEVVTVRSVASGRASPIACTAGQQEQTRQAIIAAQPMTEAAATFLGDLYYADPVDPNNPTLPRIHMKPNLRYENWFGTWDDDAPQLPDPAASETDNQRVDETVVATYLRLREGATTDCDRCVGYHPSSRAWAEGKRIHLCPVNFSDPITGGITSQAGTIAHEVSHQTDEVAQGTVDVPDVTSRASAHALPRGKAVTSGANYEYFITDTPLGRHRQVSDGDSASTDVVR